MAFAFRKGKRDSTAGPHLDIGTETDRLLLKKDEEVRITISMNIKFKLKLFFPLIADSPNARYACSNAAKAAEAKFDRLTRQLAGRTHCTCQPQSTRQRGRRLKNVARRNVIKSSLVYNKLFLPKPKIIKSKFEEKM